MKTLLVLAAIIHLAIAIPNVARADDASEVRAVITSQLEAFRANDGATAYSFASPTIKSMFGSEDRFMSMVQQGYPPVYRSSNVVFGPMTTYGKGYKQEVNLSGPDGDSWVATYTLERQDDGSMKITGCTLRKSTDIAV